MLGLARLRRGSPLLRAAAAPGRLRGDHYHDGAGPFKSDTCLGREGSPLTEYASERAAREGKTTAKLTSFFC